jgi:hypothetical protein
MFNYTSYCNVFIIFKKTEKMKPQNTNIKHTGKTIIPQKSAHQNLCNYIIKHSLLHIKTGNTIRFIEKEIDKDDISTFKEQKEKLLTNKLYFYPEAIPFLFKLEGCSQKLLFYILLFELNYNTGKFVFNDNSLCKFNDFCVLTALLHE